MLRSLYDCLSIHVSECAELVLARIEVHQRRTHRNQQGGDTVVVNREVTENLLNKWQKHWDEIKFSWTCGDLKVMCFLISLRISAPQRYIVVVQMRIPTTHCLRALGYTESITVQVDLTVRYRKCFTSQRNGQK